MDRFIEFNCLERGSKVRYDPSKPEDFPCGFAELNGLGLQCILKSSVKPCSVYESSNPRSIVED